jgi:REP element-mobilizing transposase RayT
LQSRKRQSGLPLAALQFSTGKLLIPGQRDFFYRLMRVSKPEGLPMPQPLVIAHHLVWTAYGCWLPNDPRGSGSKEVHTPAIAELGEIHYGRKPVQPPGQVIREFYQEARAVLKHPLLKFDAAARAEIGAAFSEVVERERYTCWACAIMPDHVHLLLRKHKHDAETMVEALKDASRNRLYKTGRRVEEHPTWCGGYNWHFYVNHPDEVRRTTAYIERNPLPLGLPTQRWPFVKVYDGWPLHPGHSPNSPYAKRLRELGQYLG